MKKLIIFAAFIILAGACNDDNDAHRVSDLKYATVEVLQKNGSGVKYQLEDGRIVESFFKSAPSGQYVSMGLYVYNEAGQLSSVELGSGRQIYMYNDKNEVTESIFTSEGDVISATQYFYKAGGILDYTVENVWPTDTIYFVMTKYKYEGGNPVELVRSMYNKESNTTTYMYTDFQKFDTKINPYHLLKLDFTIPSENNVVEMHSSEAPDRKTIISYTYNDSGLPTNFVVTTNFDGQRREGEYIYQAIQK